MPVYANGEVKREPSPGKAREELTGRQRRFVEEYLVDLNATAAYRRAGYEPRNDNVAAVQAHKLLKNAKVQEAVRAASEARSQRTEITQDYVLHQLQSEAERRGMGSSH